MTGAKLKVLAEEIYEEAMRKFMKNGISPVIACMVMKSVVSRFQDNAMVELSFKLLKTKQQKPPEDGVKEQGYAKSTQ